MAELDGVKALAALHNAGELTAEVERLRAENQRLTARIADLENSEVMLSGIRPAKGGGTILELVPPERITGMMLKSFKAFLDEQDAPNYIEQVWSANGSSERYVVIIGRPGGKTPHEMRADAVADRDRLTAVIDQVRELHSPTPSALDGDGPDDYCAHCGEEWPCPTAALLPDTHTAQDPT